MNRRTAPALAAGLLPLLLLCAVPPAAAAPWVRLETEAGDIVLELDPGPAPHHAASFAHLARTGFFDGTAFHRVVPGFVIQGGDPNTLNDDPADDGSGGPTLRDVLGDQEYAQVEAANRILAARGYVGLREASLVAEFSDTARHRRGTLSMARADDPNSAGSQFFICVAPQPRLDGKYSIFGHVVAGMDVVDSIVNAPTRPGTQSPVAPVHIISTTVADDPAALGVDAEGARE